MMKEVYYWSVDYYTQYSGTVVMVKPYSYSDSYKHPPHYGSSKKEEEKRKIFLTKLMKPSGLNYLYYRIKDYLIVTLTVVEGYTVVVGLVEPVIKRTVIGAVVVEDTDDDYYYYYYSLPNYYYYYYEDAVTQWTMEGVRY